MDKNYEAQTNFKVTILNINKENINKIRTKILGIICDQRDHLGDPGVEGRIILRLIFRKWDVCLWTRSSWLRIGTGGGHL